MPKFLHLKRYCEHTGWELYNEDGDHYFYRKLLPYGTLLRTKVSRSLGTEIGPALFQEILKRQLKTTKEEFNKNS